MKNRLLAAVLAVVFAGVGGILMMRYAATADQRAMAGMETTTVLVTTRAIPADTPAEKLADSVQPRELPRAAVAAGALTSLAAVAGQVTTADLGVGEQLVPTRFAAPGGTDGPGVVAVPAGLHEISVRLDAQRGLGNALAPGDRVGVTISMTQPNQTHLTLTKVLVLAVQGAVPAEGDAAAQQNGAAPESALLVTFAVSSADLERLVFGAEHGTLWLSRETPTTKDSGTRVVTRGNLYP